MHTHDLSSWTHSHSFNAPNAAAERGTRWVVVITSTMMVIEIIAGWRFNSMALLADGWHMSSHAIAIGLSAYAYAAARRLCADPRYAFGTWKIEILGGFASAIVLLGVGAMMVFGSVERMLSPQLIHYRAALVVAVVGLLVNVLCAGILGHARQHGPADASPGHGHDHGHPNDPSHAAGIAHAGRSPDAQDAHPDLNLKSAYVHVLADAATSLLAIAALIGGGWYGWPWLDPAMGVIGAILIALWARSVLTATGKILLDREMDHPVVNAIRAAVETDAAHGATRVVDLHVWRVGKHAYACALSLVTHDAQLTATTVRARLAAHAEIAHLTVEIHQCT